MPSTPKIVTRSATTSSNSSDNLNKGSKLTFAEMDSNFIELKNGAIGVVADDSSTLDVKAGDTLYIQGGSNVTTSTDSAGVLTINSTGEVTASSTTTFTNKTFDVEATGNSISNIDVADLKSGVLDTDLSSVSGSDDTLASAKAIKAYVDTQDAATGIGDLTAIGSTLISPSNANLTLDPSGTGTIELNANTNVTGNLTASGSLNTDGIEIHDNNIKATRTNDDLILQTNNTGIVALEGNVRVGEDRASGAANATVTGGTGQNLSLIGGNADAGEVKVMAGPANGSGETGEIFLKPGAAEGVVHVGSGSGTARITSNGAHDLILRTNDGGTEPHIQLIDGANGNINIVPHQGGTGMVSIGNQATLSTGDGGGGRVKVAGITFQDPVGRKNFTAMDIPFSADGSTSSDMRIRLDSNADPIIEFNKASDGNNGAKIKVLDGSLLLQTEGVNSSQGNIRIDAAGDITLDASGNLNLGSGTIVVSGNKMFTDASNEDFELLANGTGNISMLSQANMNSNKIVNVTDPTSAQDAATKAYVDANVGSTGDLSIIGSTISSPSNADLTLTTSGTGVVAIDNLTVDSNINITDNEIKTTTSNSDLKLSASSTGRILTRNILEINSNDGGGGTWTGSDKIVFTGNSALLTGHYGKTIECEQPSVGNTNLHLKPTSGGKVLLGHSPDVQIPSTRGSGAGGIELLAEQGGVANIVFNTGDSAGTYSQAILAPDADSLSSDSVIRLPGGTDQYFVGTEATQTLTNKTLTSPVLNTGVSGTAIKDEDNMSSNSATHLATQQSIKAYVDSNSGASTGDITFVGSTMISPSNADITLNPAGTGKVNINAVYTLPNADGSANQVLGTNGSGVLSFRDPTAINIDGGVADSTYTSVPTIDGGTA